MMGERETRNRLRRAAGAMALAAALLASGCGHKHKKQPLPQQTAPAVRTALSWAIRPRATSTRRFGRRGRAAS